jgi:hypothetical protein
LDVNIARQIAQPWDLASQRENQSDDNQADSQEDERLAESIHQFCNSRMVLVMGGTSQTKSRGFQKRLGWFFATLPLAVAWLRSKCSKARGVATRPRGVRFRKPA